MTRRRLSEIFIGNKPPADQYTPNASVDRPYVELAEVEVLRLVDMLGHSQEEVGEIWGSLAVQSGGYSKGLGKRRLKPSQRGEGSEFCLTTKKADQGVGSRTLLTA
jgi:hypothetical protein